MSFAAPLLLLLLLLAPLAIVLYVLDERRRQSRSALASPALLPSVAPRRAGWRRHVGPAAYLLAAAVLVVAIARPERSVAVPIEQASVMLVTDVSGSMRATDVAPNRMAAAKAASFQFLDDVPRDVRVGAIAFSNRVRLLSEPTTNRERVRQLTAELTARGSTAAGDALAAAIRVLRPSGVQGKPVPASIVLLSDGETVRGQDPLAVAEAARKTGIRIFTIALGTDGGTLTSRRRNGTVKTEPVPPDRETLRKIAELSGGKAFDAPDDAALSAAYQELGSAVVTEPGKKQTTSIVVAAAMALVLAGAGASLVLVGRVI